MFLSYNPRLWVTPWNRAMTEQRMERDLNLNRPSDNNDTIHVVIADGDTFDSVPVVNR